MNVQAVRPVRRLLGFFSISLMGLMLAGCGLLDKETFHPPLGEGPSVLVDLYHSRLQNHEDYRLSKWNYNYQGVFGYYRAFEHLHHNGYDIRSIRQMPLSAARLDGFDVLFINLVDAKRPDFSGAEYRAIDQWVKDGGGLFIIADHTNVYRSSERINPILAPMGIEVGYHTAVDYPPEHAVQGTGWLMLWDFAPHYITRGVEMISPQTGGPIFGAHGIGWTSSGSFADYWDEQESTGFYGNWTHDGDEALEPRGPLAMVAARQWGKGRVVVVGDQNIFGDAWLYFANNFDLMMNAFQWLAGQDDAPRVRTARPSGLNIGLDMAHNDFAPGRNGDDNYYPFFVNFNRDSSVTARARLGIDSGDDALFLLDPSHDFDAAALADIKDYFERGKTVVLSFDADAINPATTALLAELAPDFSVDITSADGSGAHLAFSQASPESLRRLDIAHLPGAHPLFSDAMDLADLRLSSMPRRGMNWPPGLPPYLLAITSSWGMPLVSAQIEADDALPQGAPTRIDIARQKAVGNGRLIVFMQDGFFRNRTLGFSEVTAPTEQNRDAIEFQYRFIDYLKAQNARTAR